MIKTLVFDIGNVLVDWRPENYVPRFVESKEEADELSRIIFTQEEWIKGDTGEFTREETRKALVAKYSDRAELINKILEGCNEILLEYKPTTEFLKILKTAGFEIYYISNTNPSAFEYMQERHEYFSLFSGGVASYKIGLLKPSHEIFHYFLKEYDKKADECIFVDDLPENTKGAAECGFNTITLKNLADLKNELLKFEDIKKAVSK